jgi:putative transposase
VVDTTMDGLSWVRKQVEQADTDLLREVVRLFCERVMSEEVDGICGAPYGERSEERTNRRNGYRSRAWDTRTGTIDLAVPKLREGSYFPDWLLEPRRRAERAFVQVVCESYVRGVSTGRIEGLVRTLGIERISQRRSSGWPRNSITRSKPSAPGRLTAVPTPTSGSTRSPRRCVRTAGSATSPA